MFPLFLILWKKIRGICLVKSSKTVSVIMAGYNESNNIQRAMKDTYEMLEANFCKFEMILVDDASKDSTLFMMEQFAKDHPNVKVLPNYCNLNYGASTLRGICAAENDYVTFNACDLPLAIDDMLTQLLEMDEDVDVLVMQRTDYKTTKWRCVTSQINSLLLHILFPKLMSGTPVLNYVQIYKKQVIRDILPLARSPIFVWCELVFRAKLKGYHLVNVMVKCNVENIRKGAFGHPHDIIWGIYDMIRFRIRLWNNSY